MRYTVWSEQENSTLAGVEGCSGRKIRLPPYRREASLHVVLPEEGNVMNAFFPALEATQPPSVQPVLPAETRRAGVK
jgi:hypothetical protein